MCGPNDPRERQMWRPGYSFNEAPRIMAAPHGVVYISEKPGTASWIYMAVWMIETENKDDLRHARSRHALRP